MLLKRLLSASILIVSVLTFVVLDYRYPILNCFGIWMLPVGLYMATGTAMEVVALFKSAGFPVLRRWTIPAVAATFLVSAVPLLYPITGNSYPVDCPVGKVGWIAIGLSTSLIGLSLVVMYHFDQRGKAIAELATSVFTVAYVGGSCSFWIPIRLSEPNPWGLVALVGIIATTKLADAGAYFAGKAIGRTKLCPKISPGKTIEGLIGGVVTASLGAILYFRFLSPWLVSSPNPSGTWIGCIILGVVLTLAGLIGDLMESLIKRDVGAKDSGKMLPGLGGLWDVTDSMLPTAMIGYLAVVGKLIAPNLPT